MQFKEEFLKNLQEINFTFEMCEDFYGENIHSDYYKCLPAILAGLNWQQDINKIIDSLPNYNKPIDSVDLLNILSLLGYVGHEKKVISRNIDNRVLPCLGNGIKKYPVIILQIQDNIITYYDPQNEKLEESEDFDKTLKLIYFTKNENLTGLKDSYVNPSSGEPIYWFLSILSRFKKLFIHFFLTSFFINIIGLLSPLYVMTVYDKVIGGRDPETLIVLFTAAILVLSLDVTLRRFRAKNISWLSSRMNFIIKTALYRKLLDLSLFHTDQISLSGLYSKVKSFSPVKDFMNSPSCTMLLEFPFILLYLVVILYFSPILGLVPIIAMGLYTIYAFYILNLLEVRKEKSETLKGLKQEIVHDTIDKLEDLKKLTNLNVWEDRFKNESGNEAIENFKTSILLGKIETASYFLTTVSGLVTLLTGIYLVWEEKLSIGALVATMMIIWRIISPLQLICLSISRFKQFKAVIEGIHRFLSIDSEKIHLTRENLYQLKKEGNLSLETVGIKFAKMSTSVISGLSLDIKHGDFVTLAGPAGSGKRVLLKLLGGFYFPQMGSVRINGIDLRQMDSLSLRKLISTINTFPLIINGTILDNLRLADYTASEEKVIEALKESELYSHIAGMENGVHQEMDNNFNKSLSLEFMFKFSLTRAILKNTPINIIENIPNSIINSIHRVRFIRKFRKSMRDKTIILATKDKDIIASSDLLILQLGGNQIFTGQPDKLLKALDETYKNAI